MNIETAKELLKKYRDDELFGVAGREAIETVLSELEKKDKIVKSIIQRLENDIKNITETKADGHTNDYRRCRLKAYRTKTREIKEYIEKEYFNKVEREGK